MIDFSKLSIDWDTFTYIDKCKLYKVIFDRKSPVDLPEVLKDLCTVIKVTDKVLMEFELPKDKISHVIKKLDFMNLVYNDGSIGLYKLTNPVYYVDDNKLIVEFNKLKCYRFFIDYQSISGFIDWNKLTYSGDKNDIIPSEIKEFPEALNRVMDVSDYNEKVTINLYPPQSVLHSIYDNITKFKSLTLLNNISGDSRIITDLYFDRVSDLRNLSGTGKDLYINIDGRSS